VPELRLLGCVEVDRVFALPLQKDTDLVSVPLNAKIKLQRAKNMEQLENFIEYARFLEKAQRYLVDARDRIQLIDLKLAEKDKKEPTRSFHLKKSSSSSALSANGFVLRKSASCDSSKFSSHNSSLEPIADEYDEIDQIYDYVRGFAPLPKNSNKFEAMPEPMVNGKNSDPAKSPIIENNNNYSNVGKSMNNYNDSVRYHSHNHHHHHHYSMNCGPKQAVIMEEKPTPPPIETIPGKKVPEKRQRPTLPKLYVKNTNGNVHSKSPNSNQAIIMANGKDLLEPQSPLFHIR
jgi:hypothetical protein